MSSIRRNNNARQKFSKYIISMIFLLCFFEPAIKTMAGNPLSVPGQQSGWGFSFETSYNWEVNSPEENPPELDFGCWGSYANGYGEGSGVPWEDGTINKWARIDETGQISGGCWIMEGVHDDGRIMKGSLSGTFVPETQSFSKFHLETMQIITNTIDGKISWWMDSMVVEGTGDVLNPPDSQYTHRIIAKVTKTSQGHNVPVTTQRSSVSFRAYVMKIEQPYRLRAEQISNNLKAPADYQPLSYRFTLEEKNGEGSYAPIKKVNVKISNVWTEESIHFLTYFKASNCQNCVHEAVGNQVYYRTEKVPDDILIQTDDTGQFTMTFFPNLGKLAQAGIFPTPNSPLNRKIKAAYYGSGSGTTPLVETFIVVKLEAIGIIEALGYREPGTFDAYGNPAPMPWPKNLSDFRDDPGIEVEGIKLSSNDRVRFYIAGEGWVSNASKNPPGDTAAPGTLLFSNTALYVNACDLDKNYNNSYANKTIYKPGELRVKIRFFDGVSAMISVNSDVCNDTFTMGVSTGEIAVTQTIEEYLFEYVVSSIRDKGIEMIAEKFIPYYEVYDKIKNISEVIDLVKESAGRKSIFVRLNSKVLIETNVNGEVRVTTLEGEPVIMTDAITGEGMVVEAGKTASIPDTLVPSIQKTDPETAERANQLVQEMAGTEPSVETLPDSPQASQQAQRLILLAMCGFLGCGAIGTTSLGIGFWIWRRGKKAQMRKR